jgi:hypothetical protein
MADAKVHPNDTAGLSVDMPRTGLAGGAAQGAGAFRLSMSVKSTGQNKGWLGVSTNNWVDLVGDKSKAAVCEWYTGNDGKNYLQINNATVYRYIGIGANDYASWGLNTPSGQWHAISARDNVIYLADDGPTPRALYPYGNDWVCWGNTDTILKYEEVRD